MAVWEPIDFLETSIPSNFFTDYMVKDNPSHPIYAPNRFCFRAGETKSGWSSGVATLLSKSSSKGKVSENERVVRDSLSALAQHVNSDTDVRMDGVPTPKYAETRLKLLTTLRHNLTEHNAFLVNYNTRFLLSVSHVSPHVQTIALMDKEIKAIKKTLGSSSSSSSSSVSSPPAPHDSGALLAGKLGSLPNFGVKEERGEGKKQAALQALFRCQIVLQTSLQKDRDSEKEREELIEKIKKEITILDGKIEEKENEIEEAKKTASYWTFGFSSTSAVAEEREREKVSMEGEKKNATDFLENAEGGLKELRGRIQETEELLTKIAKVEESQDDEILFSLVSTLTTSSSSSSSSSSPLTSSLPVVSPNQSVPDFQNGPSLSEPASRAPPSSSASTPSLDSLSMEDKEEKEVESKMKVVELMRKDLKEVGGEEILSIFECLVKKVGEGSGYLRSWSLIQDVFTIELNSQILIYCPPVDPLTVDDPSTGSTLIFGAKNEDGEVRISGTLKQKIVNFTYGFQTYSRLPAKYDTWVIRKLVGNRVTSDISNITITGEDAFKMDLSAAGRDIQRQGVTHELVEYWGSGRVVKDLEKSIE